MSINVKDAAGSTVAIEVPNANGQAAMANSAPVVIASDQSAVPVSVASLPLPTGAATQASLASVDSKLASLGQKAMVGSVPVALASDQPAIPVSGPATDVELRATPLPVSGPVTDAQIRATPVPVSGTVTATGPVTDTELRATPVPVSGPLTDTQIRATALPVSGPVTDTELRATPVPVSGTVTATGPVTDTELRATPVPVESPGFVSAVDTTRPADTTAYAALDVLGQDPAANLVFTGVGSVAGGHVIIMDVSFRQDVGAIPSGQDGFRLHLFDAAPTAIIDNATFNLIAADRTKYLGSIDLSSSLDLGDTIWSRSNNINFKCKLASASTTIYGVLQTIAAFTPSASTVRNVRISGIQC
jgi:hypothetical protein